MIKKFENFNNTLGITKIKTILGDSNSVPISNNSQILQELVNYQQMAFRNKEKSLLRSMEKELTKLFGGPVFNISGKKLWKLEYENLKFKIFTKDGEGTNIEICDHTYNEINKGKNLDKILDFLETFYALINNKNLEEIKLRKQAKKYNL